MSVPGNPSTNPTETPSSGEICSVVFYSSNNYDGTSYGPWDNGTYTFVHDFSDNSINSFIATSNRNDIICYVTMYSGCCPVQGTSATFEINPQQTRYVNRATTGESGDISNWMSGSIWVSGIVVGFEEISMHQFLFCPLLYL